MLNIQSMATIIQTEKDGDKMYGPPIIGSVCVWLEKEAFR